MPQQTLFERFQKMTIERGGPATGAEFSPCRTYRYALWRHWDWQGHANCVMFIGLNPSTADETKNDLTISRCIGFAKQWGYSGLYMLNLFAFRSTYPTGLLHVADPVGPGNDEAFGYYRTRVGLIVAAWGSVSTKLRVNLHYSQRIDEVTQAVGKVMSCLGRTQDGSPRHPSRLGYATKNGIYWTPED